nr:hypothetical protein [Comamonas koreensis]
MQRIPAIAALHQMKRRYPLWTEFFGTETDKDKPGMPPTVFCMPRHRLCKDWKNKA